MNIVSNYKFEVIEELGKGGFGFVEKIKLFNLSETHHDFYARKVLDQQSDLKNSKERFIREVKIQCQCKHSNIVHIFIHDLNKEQPYFIMELAECDLSDLILNNLLTEENKIKILFDTCLGVEYIHNRGFLHRDIKPNNILKFYDGNYKISDFGLIRSEIQDTNKNNLTSFGTVLGTEDYLAPELRYKGNDYTIKSDIFSMGKVFEQLNIENSNIKEHIEKCTSLDPKYRYSSVSDLIKNIKNI